MTAFVRHRDGRIVHRVYQETIGQPIVQEERKIANDTDPPGVDEELVSKRTWR